MVWDVSLAGWSVVEDQGDEKALPYEFPDDFILGSMAELVLCWGKGKEHMHAPEANKFFWPNGWVCLPWVVVIIIELRRQHDQLVFIFSPPQFPIQTHFHQWR